MRAQEFLKQLSKLNMLIENKLIEKQQWKSIAMGIGQRTDGERVQSSGSQQKMADAIARYVDIEKEIDAAIDKFVDTRIYIISVIEKLPAVEYDLLHKVYVQGIELAEVAAESGKSYSWATSTHGRALKTVQDILDSGKE
jgi:hypothetical protein